MPTDTQNCQQKMKHRAVDENKSSLVTKRQKMKIKNNNSTIVRQFKID